jgi:4-hydroxybenzoyl-CoA thioesterase
LIVYQRPIHFDEVDPAGIVFFARYANIAHEAVENFFSSLEGGYPGLVRTRKMGMPIVHLEADFRAPLRYGDTLRVETACAKLGNSSATFVHEMKNGESLCAVVRHVVVCVRFDDFKSCPMPVDVRARLREHLLE